MVATRRPLLIRLVQLNKAVSCAQIPFVGSFPKVFQKRQPKSCCRLGGLAFGKVKIVLASVSPCNMDIASLRIESFRIEFCDACAHTMLCERIPELTVSLRRLELLSSFSAEEAPLALRLLSMMIIIDRVA